MDSGVIKTVNMARWTDGLNVRNRLEDITYNPMRSQEDFVMRLLRENSRTEYGRKYNFRNIHSIDEFRRCVPLTDYVDYKSYFKRIADGERNVLTAYLTEHISVLDGFKKMPQSRWGVQANYDYSFCSGFYLVGNHGFLTDGMTLNLVDNSVERLPSGITIGNMLGRLLVKREFDNDQVYVIPVEVTNSPQRNDILYMQSLFALSQKYISLAICDRYDNLLEMLRYIEKHWPTLADNIERGNPYIQPAPERAHAIREIMDSHHVGTQMVEQLWPGLHCIIVYDVDRLSAGFELLRTYCGSNVHFVFTGISSPEGTFSTALNLDDPQTVLIPDSVFYEFKPKEAADYKQLLTLDQLEIGRNYELTVTTLSGLYRYKTRKTLLVVGRYHDTPTVIVDKG
ncbi:MAG: GH3 auxin-responsive promoter family protein [Prevotella sp.]|nr:GH3 auxin-responsive promoter family protein [Prevotella sp.]